MIIINNKKNPNETDRKRWRHTAAFGAILQALSFSSEGAWYTQTANNLKPGSALPSRGELCYSNSLQSPNKPTNSTKPNTPLLPSFSLIAFRYPFEIPYLHVFVVSVMVPITIFSPRPVRQSGPACLHRSHVARASGASYDCIHLLQKPWLLAKLFVVSDSFVLMPYSLVYSPDPCR